MPFGKSNQPVASHSFCSLRYLGYLKYLNFNESLSTASYTYSSSYLSEKLVQVHSKVIVQLKYRNL